MSSASMLSAHCETGCALNTNASLRNRLIIGESDLSGTIDQPAFSTLVSQPRCSCSALGNLSRLMAGCEPFALNATRNVEPCATGKTTLPSGNSMPCGPTGLGERIEMMSDRVSAIAIGKVDSLLNSMTKSPP